MPYDVVWRTKIETYMGRMEAAVLDAARAGYASRAPTWTMAGALLYSASLTTLVGRWNVAPAPSFSIWRVVVMRRTSIKALPTDVVLRVEVSVAGTEAPEERTPPLHKAWHIL